MIKMGKRGRFIKRIKAIKTGIEIKKKATSEQLEKLKIGYNSYLDIRDKMKAYKKAYKETNEPVFKDKYERIEKILSLLRKSKIYEAKRLGEEYENIYPHEFD